jgi:Family of unknown function (DUF6516)
MARAFLLLDYKAEQGDLLVQMVLWRLPGRSASRPQGIKYRLYLGRAEKTMVRYDNEIGKGNHRHVGAEEAEEPYVFTTVERLLEDFRNDCERLGWRWDK